MDRNRHMATRTAHPRDNVNEVVTSSTQADEFLRWARAADRTAPLPAPAVAALERLERAFAASTAAKAVA